MSETTVDQSWKGEMEKISVFSRSLKTANDGTDVRKNVIPEIGACDAIVKHDDVYHG